MKRKRIDKQTQTQARCREEQEQEQYLYENANSNNGVVAMLHSPQDHNVRSRAVFILENASLKKGLVKKEWKILSSQDDANLLLKQNKNLNDYRPDILFEALRTIIDNPLNKYGLVGAIFVKIDGGALFEIKPHVRIPRTCKRFCGLIMKNETYFRNIVVELLQKSCVRAKNTNEVLLRVIEEPVTRHLPVQSHIVVWLYMLVLMKHVPLKNAGLSYSSQKLVDIDDYVSVLGDDVTPVLWYALLVGAMVNGKVNRDHTHDYISVSDYPLGAKCCVGLICDALEQKWKLF